MKISHIKIQLRGIRYRVKHSHKLHTYRRRARIYSSRLVHGSMTAVVIFSVIPAVLLSGLFDGRVFAASQGPRTATASGDCVNDTSIGTLPWTTPGNAFSSNDSYATVNPANGNITQYAKCTNFGFTVPAGSIIDGITATAERVSGAASKMYDNKVSIVKGGTIGTTDMDDGLTTPWPTIEGSKTYGTSTSLWGETWSVTDINASNFGVALSAYRNGTGGGFTASLDNMTITVHYTVTTTFEQSGYRWFNNVDSSGGNIDVGTALNGVSQNTATTALAEQQIFRLRMLLHASTASNADVLKLQYAQRGTDNLCDTSFANETYTDVTTTSAIAYANNTVAADGAGLTTNANDPTHSGHTIINQQYNEVNNTSVVNAIASGQDGMWDFALKDNGAAATTAYCFRLVFSAGVLLNSYSVIPQITTQAINLDQTNSRWYKGQDALVNNTFAQASGATGSGVGRSVVQTLDGGYAVTGETNSYGGTYEMYISKYDNLGSLSWTRTWGSTGADYGRDIAQTTDDGYIVCGYTTSYGAGDMFLAKYDSSGGLTWSQTMGGAIAVDLCQSVIQTSDGGYAVTGYTSTYTAGLDDMFLSKYDVSGNLSWTRTWGNTLADFGYALVQTSDGGYAVAGHTESYGGGGKDMLLVKFDTFGNLDWSRTWGSTGDDRAQAIAQTSDGSYVIAGLTNSYSGNYDMALVKFDNSGTLSWSRTWGANATADYGWGLSLTADGGYVVSGQTESYGAGAQDVFLTKYSSAGTLSWSRTMGGTGGETSNAHSHTADGGFIVTGYGDTYGIGTVDTYLLKYDLNGDIFGCPSPICTSPTATTGSPSVTPGSPSVTPGSPTAATATRTITNTPQTPTTTGISGYLTYGQTSGGGNIDYAHGVVAMDDGGYVAVGRTASYTGSYDVLISRFDSIGTLVWSRTWGSTGADYPGYDVIKTSDGGLVFTGYNTSLTSGGADMQIVKFDASGNLVWDAVWGGLGNETGYAVLEDNSGNFIVAGQSETTTNSAGLADIAIVKFNSSGIYQWDRQWGGAGNEYAYSMQLTADGNYLIAGSTALGAGSQDAVMLKYDTSGNLLWDQTWGSTANEVAYDVTETKNGDYYLVGFTAGDGAGSNDVAIVKYNSNRDVIWAKTWGGAASDFANKVQEALDGGVIITATTSSFGSGAEDSALIKLDRDGNLVWDRTWGGTGSEAPNDIAITGDGGFVVVGLESSFTATADFAITKYTSDGLMIGCSATVCREPAATLDPVNPGILVTNDPSATLNTPNRTPQYPTWAKVDRTPTTAVQTAKKVWGEAVPVPAMPLAAQDTASPSNRHDDPLRLRFNLGVLSGGKPAKIGGANLKLQVAPRVGTCDTSFTGESYTDLSGSTAFNYYDNTNLTNNDYSRAGPYDPTAAGALFRQNYQEAAGFTNRFAMSTGEYGMWDISLTTTDDAVYNSYCFRVVNNDNSLLNTYTRVFEVSIPPAAKQQMRHGKFFDTNTGVAQPFYW